MTAQGPNCGGFAGVNAWSWVEKLMQRLDKAEICLGFVLTHHQVGRNWNVQDGDGLATRRPVTVGVAFTVYWLLLCNQTDILAF